MAVKGKKQQQKPAPKLVKHQEEEEENDDESEEESDAAEDEELEEQSDEEVAGQEEEEDDDDDEEEEAKPAERDEYKKGTEDAGTDDEKKTTIFVGHINYQLTKKELDDFFGKAGEIETSRIITKRGYAFVTYADPASVEEALKLDKQVLSGKAVHVERVKSKKMDSAEKNKLKRKRNKEENEKGAKKAKMGDKVVQMKRNFNKGGKGKPKTPQHTNPNKKKNKPKAGQFVKAQ